MSQNNPHLSIIIPTYNEARRLSDSLHALYHEYLDLALFPYEVIIADDGSTDDTPGMVEEKLLPIFHNLRLLPLPHKGKGHAVKHGMLHARGQWRMMADADFSMPVYELRRMVPQPGTPNHPSVLIASRDTLDIDVRRNPLRWLGGKAFNFAVRSITGLPFTDTQCGFKLFSHHAAVDIFSRVQIDGFAFDVEALLIAVELGYYGIGTIGVDWYEDPDSRVNFASDALTMLKDVVAIKQRLRAERERAGIETPVQ